MLRTLLVTLLGTLCFNMQAQQQHILPTSVQTVKKSAVHAVAADRDCAITGNETIAAHAPASSNAYRSGAGEVIGDSDYDLQSNYGMCRRLAMDPNNGNVYAAWTMSHTGGGDDRGSGFNTMKAGAWGEIPADRLENVRVGWPNLGVTETGRVFSITHSGAEGMHFVYSDDEGATWNNISAGLEADDASGVWPRAAVDGQNIHVIISRTDGEGSGLVNGIKYIRSKDNGDTWETARDIEDLFLYVGDMNADSYSIDAKDGVVAMAVGSVLSPVVLIKSLDNGDNWDISVVQNTNNPLLDDSYDLDYGRKSGGSHSVIIDDSGKVHMWYDVMISSQPIENMADGSFFPFPDAAGIEYWNEDMDGPMLIGQTVRQDYDQDGNTKLADEVEYGSYGASMVSQVSAGIDGDGNLYAAYASQDDGAYEVDNPLRQYRDVYLIKSTDGGATWVGPYNVSDSDETEDVYPSIARMVDDKVRVLWQSDNLTGTGIQNANGEGHADLTNNEYRYVEVAIEDIVTPETPVNTEPELYLLSIPTAALEGCQPNFVDDFYPDIFCFDYPDGELFDVALEGTVDISTPNEADPTGSNWLFVATDMDGNVESTDFADSFDPAVAPDITVFAETDPPVIYGEPVDFFDIDGTTYYETLFDLFATVEVVQGTSYEDLGAEVRGDGTNFGCEPVLSVDIPGGLIDGTASIGEYTVTYTAVSHTGLEAEAVIRTVVVIASDLNAPTITLYDEEGEELADGSTVTIEAGSGAWDGVDYVGYDAVDGLVDVVIGGDAVDTETLGTYTVVYSATDAAGNSTETTVVVEVVDNTAPVIGITPATLPLNSATAAFNCGDDYYFDFNADGQLILFKPDGPDGNTDPDVAATITAFDGYDGNITSNVTYTITNSAGNEIEGNEICTGISDTYTVVFAVSDNSGNETVRDNPANPLLQPLTIIVVGCNTGDTVACIGTGITENTLGTVDMYPNPIKNTLNVNLESLTGEISLEVYNVTGQVVSATQTTGNSIATLDFATQASGVYFVKVTTNEGSFTKRVVVE
ncbi:MAG: T9SS type A sorting domain-containing protein [Chitinophagales bacterium]